LFGLPGYRMTLAVFGLTSVAGWILYTWLPLYVYEHFGIGLAEAGFTATFYIQAGSFGGILAGGWLSDQWVKGSRRARLLTAALGFMVTAPFLFAGGRTSSLVLLSVALVVFGLGRGFYDCNIMPYLSSIARPGLRATGYGIYNLVGTGLGGFSAL